ncbi:MAG: Trk system potassium transporter TrkA [Clostridia bacterium]|nr:Trk system potassium transporter TrkA [Clostridia bacterium]MBQ1435439.1 Trk system potassium transporter TrkA [Clostridia bacterium]MBQ4248553.1 Trk system potassium transporter TrkA [Clostridia bacterium]
MKIVVIGGGKIGSALTEQLAKENHQVTVVDKSRRVVTDITNSFDVMGVCGGGATVATQTEAGVPDADLLIACTNSDEMNLLCCLVAKKLGAQYTIARVRNPEYNEQIQLIREELGLSLVINPELVTARELFRMLRFPSAAEIDTFSGGRAELVGFKVRENSVLSGLQLKDLPKKVGARVLICVVQRGDEVYIPTGDFIIRSGDIIRIVASRKNLEAFFGVLGALKRDVASVMLIGGSRIAFYLSQMLLAIGIKVKIIEIDEKRAVELCELLPKAIIINGDATDQSVLLEEGLDNTDAVVTLTGSDEENIIIAMYVTGRNVQKVIAKVSRPSLSGLVAAAGLESAVSPREITANGIVQYVRALNNSIGSNVETLHTIAGGRVEALEFLVRSHSPDIVGVPLSKLQIKENILIACITRGSELIIPGGSTEIMRGDNVIVVTTNPGLKDLSDILK